MIVKKNWAILWLLWWVGICLGQTDFTNSWNDIVHFYVVNGFVDYKSLKSDSGQLYSVINQLSFISKSEVDSWSEEEQIAFWINAYNAITVWGIVRNYPIQWGGLMARIRFPQNSIRQINGFWDKDWVQLNGDPVTLNEIEHEILRKKFSEPRIHFAINCASMGCPVLRSEAYQADMLGGQLEDATRTFISDTTRVRLSRKDNILFVSSIFKWYREDFKESSDEPWLDFWPEKYRGVIWFIYGYLPQSKQEYIKLHRPKLEFLPYDWSLNEKK